MGCYSGNPKDTRLIDFDDIFGRKWMLLWCFCTVLLPDFTTQCVTPTLIVITLEFLLQVAHFHDGCSGCQNWPKMTFSCSF